MKKYAILFSILFAFFFSSCPVGTRIAEPNATPQPSAPGPIASHSPEPVYPEGPAYYDPPTTALGAGRLFDIGPGDYGNPDRTYREVHEFPWLDLIAGDVVRIHHRIEPYRGLIYLRVHGTQEAPVRIYGVAGNGGELPVISGENALMSEELYQYAVDDWTLGLGLIVINDDWNDKPTHIEIANLDIRDASIGNRFGYYDGTGVLRQRPWGRCSGIWLKAGNVSILGCKVHNNNEGIFSQANSDLIGDISSNLLIQGSQIFYNGTLEGSVDENGAPVRNDLDHNLYIQSAGAVIEFCRIGAMRPTSGGSALKDRSSGTVIRYNFIESGARLLDLVEPEDTAGIIVDQTTYVYGNILINDFTGPEDVPKSSAMIHFGFDNDPAESRQGTLCFYNNTVFLRCSLTGAAGNWRTRLFEIGREDAIVHSDPVEMYNNLIHVIPSASGDDPTYFNMLSVFGDIRTGSGNWITSWNSDWCRVIDAGGFPYFDPAEPEPAWGTMTLIDPSHPLLTGADPGFVDANAYDFHLSANSPLRGSGAALPSYLANSFPVDYQYRDGARHTARASMDCPGALE